MRWIWILGLTLALPGAALAGWTACPGSTSDTGTNPKTVPNGGALCYRKSNADEPARLAIEHCENVTIKVEADVAAQANYDVEVHAYECEKTAAANTALTDCEKQLIDRTGDNIVDDLPMNGSPTTSRDAIYGYTGVWLGFDVVNSLSRTLEIKVICN